MRLTISRRQFIGSSAAATALAAVPHAHAAGSDVLRVGLIGCGGRGTGAAAQALKADPNVKLVAMADAFEDRLEQSLDTPQAGRGRSPPRSTCRRSAASSASTPTSR